MKIIFVPDSFKGTLSARRVCEILSKIATECIPNCDTYSLPMADGGEGTLAAVSSLMHGHTETVVVHNPLMRKTTAQYLINEETAIIEMAEASGLTLIAEHDRDIMHSTSYGTGELILAALNAGCTRIILTLGGSATNDCGIGAFSALGFRFLDENNHAIMLPCDLGRITHIDTSSVPSSVFSAQFIVACDVKNQLLGAYGATYAYGSQKGANKIELASLEVGMESFARVLSAYAECDIAKKQSAGAAGGISAACMALLNADVISGAECLLELANFSKLASECDLVITGEGSYDSQTLIGEKLVFVVQRICDMLKKPVYVIAGRTETAQRSEYVFSLCDATSETYALNNAEAALVSAARIMFIAIKERYGL